MKVANRLKGLDLVGRVSEELWMEFHEVVQEAVIKTIPMSKEALQIAEKRRKVKGKGEEERYTHLTVKFLRIAWRDKKAFLSDQYKKKH